MKEYNFIQNLASVRKKKKTQIFQIFFLLNKNTDPLMGFSRYAAALLLLSPAQTVYHERAAAAEETGVEDGDIWSAVCRGSVSQQIWG